MESIREKVFSFLFDSTLGAVTVLFGVMLITLAAAWIFTDAILAKPVAFLLLLVVVAWSLWTKGHKLSISISSDSAEKHESEISDKDELTVSERFTLNLVNQELVEWIQRNPGEYPVIKSIDEVVDLMDRPASVEAERDYAHRLLQSAVAALYNNRIQIDLVEELNEFLGYYNRHDLHIADMIISDANSDSFSEFAVHVQALELQRQCEDCLAIALKMLRDTASHLLELDPTSSVVSEARAFLHPYGLNIDIPYEEDANPKHEKYHSHES